MNELSEEEYVPIEGALPDDEGLQEKYYEDHPLDNILLLTKEMKDEAVAFLRSKGIAVRGDKYQAYYKDRDKVFLVWRNCIMYLYANPFGQIAPEAYQDYDNGPTEEASLRAAMLRDHAIYSAIFVIEDAIEVRKYLQKIYESKDKRVPLDMVCDLLYTRDTFNTAFWSLKFAAIKGRGNSEAQGTRRKTGGINRRAEVKNAAIDLLTGPDGRHYRHHARKRKGEIHIEKLADEIAPTVGLKIHATQDHLRKLIADGAIE
jgi:hypothetical protein